MFRESQSMTTIEFSKLIGISHGSLSNAENNRGLPPAKAVKNLCQNTNINIHWLYTGEGDMMAPENRPHIYNDGDLPEEPETADLLAMTREIIKSGTNYAVSLAANIRSFHHAMTTANRLNSVETQLQDVGNVVKDLINDCKEIKERLQKSDRTRQGDPEGTRGEILKKRAV